MAGLTLDAGGLIGVDRGVRRVAVLLARARETGSSITIPATALAQVIRQPARQAMLARLVRQPDTNIVPLDRVNATQVGRLLARTGTCDVVDAHVVICAQQARQAVVTSDPDDLAVLDPSLEMYTV